MPMTFVVTKEGMCSWTYLPVPALEIHIEVGSPGTKRVDQTIGVGYHIE